ncbi:UPF0176 protein [Corynebacterium mycetoides]|uniref:UPF0176 protein n=1 Tax=Corynebacterium mycetoides TaxID=38302 RepID=A0A1G9PJ37_9CORY|nr:DUF2020 domain-containing protein [Corynebacterium mycetoides]SDL98836.1 UPF0176 protein [Corynebacterium mycetoides]
MRFTLPRAAAALVAVGFLAGCSADEPAQPPTPVGEAVPALDQGLPHDALPDASPDPAGACPYLDAPWVAEANGQRVTAVGVDQRFDTPACVFWSYQDAPQLTVLVRHMPTPADAMAVVDWAAPIEYTEPASDPEGWDGGRHGGGAVPGRVGAAYSVAKGPVAVTVFTDQDESVKAQVVAEQVITTLGL